MFVTNVQAKVGGGGVGGSNDKYYTFANAYTLGVPEETEALSEPPNLTFSGTGESFLNPVR